MNPRILQLCFLLVSLFALQETAFSKELSHPPKTTPSETLTKLIKFSQATLEQAKLQSKSVDVRPSLQNPEKPFERQRLAIKLKGTSKAIRGWLKKVHSLDDYRAIAKLAISPAGDKPDQEVCTIEIHQWHTPQEGRKSSKALNKQWDLTKVELAKASSTIEVLKEIEGLGQKEEGLSFTSIEINQGLGISTKKAMTLTIMGQHKESKPIGNFYNQLLTSESFKTIAWSHQAPTMGKNGSWRFNCFGEYNKVLNR